MIQPTNTRQWQENASSKQLKVNTEKEAIYPSPRVYSGTKYKQRNKEIICTLYAFNTSVKKQTDDV
jgi:hypothetical protein